MDALRGSRWLRAGSVAGVVVAVGLIGCQTQQGGAVTELPSEIIIWEDPETGDQGSPIRDANNDVERFIVVGTNGRVQFVSDGTVCNDCETNGATIELGSGDLIDIRFGVGVVGDDVRRPFLVDRESGNFVQLVGGGNEPVTFQVTAEPFEDPNDSTDDLAIPAGEEDNPTVTSNQRQTSLCGSLGGGMLPVIMAALVGLRFARRR